MACNSIALMVAWKAALSSEPGRGVARHHVGPVISARLHVSRLAQRTRYDSQPALMMMSPSLMPVSVLMTIFCSALLSLNFQYFRSILS
jgi:hypothetical protein